jgi:hypothetical protein
LNPSQTRGKKYIQSNYGLRPEDIQFTGESPTFTTKLGGFLVKRVTGKENKVALFYPGEVDKLMQQVDKNSVILVPESGEITSMPARLLEQGQEKFGDVKLVRVETETAGPNGMIMLHLAPRGADSHHFRVNHVPMDSMLVYREGDFKLSMSTANGRPDFWLALLPEVASFD